MTTAVVELLKKTSVNEIKQEKKSDIIVVTKDESVLAALKKLMGASLISAPIIEKDSGKCVGLIDVLDILVHVIDVFEETDAQTTSLYEKLLRRYKLNAEHVSDINISHNQLSLRMFSLQSTSSLYDACQIFVQNKAQRCPIIDGQGKIVGIVTQADVLDFINQRINNIGSIVNNTVAQLKLGTKPVITVNRDVRTVEAYKQMHDSKISGLGIVDDSGALIGNLSTRDLKYIDPDHIYAGLSLTTALFNERIRDADVDERSPAISCTEATDLGTVITKMSVNRIHRMYVCNSDFNPTLIISLRDVLKLLIA